MQGTHILTCRRKISFIGEGIGVCRVPGHCYAILLQRRVESKYPWTYNVVTFIANLEEVRRWLAVALASDDGMAASDIVKLVAVER